MEIELVEGAAQEAEAFLANHEAERERLNWLSRLIEGFETPDSMELLSSTHWVATHGQPRARDQEEAVQGVAAWNERKRRMVRPDHVRVAWDRLAVEEWIEG